MTQGQQQLIMEITQSVIAVLVVGACLFALFAGNAHVMDILPVLTAVIGFYFGRQVPPVGTTPPVQVAQVAAQAATNAAQTAVTAANTATEAQLAAARAVALNAKTTGEVPVVGDSPKAV